MGSTNVREQLSYAIGLIIVSGLILVVGHFLKFVFVAFVRVGMFAGRKLGWWLSRTALYQLTTTTHDCVVHRLGRTDRNCLA